MVARSSIPAWKIPWTEEPGRLQSMGSQSRTRLRDVTEFTVFNFVENLKTHTHTRFHLTTISLKKGSFQAPQIRKDINQNK